MTNAQPTSLAFALTNFIFFYILAEQQIQRNTLKLRQTDPSHSHTRTHTRHYIQTLTQRHTHTLASVRNRTNIIIISFLFISFYQIHKSKSDCGSIWGAVNYHKIHDNWKLIRIDFPCNISHSCLQSHIERLCVNNLFLYRTNTRSERQ